MSTTTSIGGITLLFLLMIRWYRSVRSRSSIPYPPGPPGDFVLGNLRQMPTSYQWLTFADWGRKYGPLTYLNIVGKPFLVINTQKAAVDLLEKKASIYSDRPCMMMIELTGFDEGTGFVRMGPAHRKHRKFLTQSLHPRVVERDYVPLQEGITRKLAQLLLDTPDKFVDHFHRAAGEAVQVITYGEFSDGQVDFVDLGRENVGNLGPIISGYLVDFLPWLAYLPEWVPGTGFKQEVKRIKAVLQEAQWTPYNMVKSKVAAGTASSSFVRSALEASTPDNLDEGIISSAANTLFGAGSETISMTLCTFILAMLLYPDVQARARAEIDRVIEEDRLPTFASKDTTPYLNAVILETLRWHPSVPNGIPHRVVQDDVYEGRLIPAGTTVFVNAWGILHDENHFPDPMTFNPDRFLHPKGSSEQNGEGQNKSDAIIDPWDVAFGYGRRICVGIPVARSGLWLAMATILACFDIRPKIDPKTMKPILPEARWTGNSTSAPMPFVCDIIPRSRAHAERIRETVAEDVRAMKV